MQRLPFNILRAILGLLIVASVFALCLSENANAGILPIGDEHDAWSDMAFPSGVSGSYTSGTLSFVVSASPSNDLEIGPQFGPNNPGKHYDSPGTLGGPFSATLSVTGVVIESDGTVSNGGTLRITYEGSAPGSIGDDYANTLHAGPLVTDTDGGANTSTDGDLLLLGTVVEVMLDATGDNTMDIAFWIHGGALQYDNPALGTNFAPMNLGIIRLAGASLVLPSDWTSSFSFSGSGVTINVFGIPEPGTITLGLLGVMFALLGRSKWGFSGRRAG